jgi:hypothetical protein
MTFLAIYLFVFPHYLKPSEELLKEQHFILKILKQKAEEKREINLRLYSSLRQKIKMSTANSFLRNWDVDLQNVLKLALNDLNHLNKIRDIERRLENTNTFIQHLPFGSYFKNYLFQLNLTKPKMETNESISLAKQYVEIELLKMETFYLKQILSLTISSDYFKPKNYLIRAKFNKSNYQIGEEMEIDLEFYESKITNYTNWDVLTINGKLVDENYYRKDHVIIKHNEYENDSINVKFSMNNPVTGATRTYQSKFRIK